MQNRRFAWWLGLLAACASPSSDTKPPSSVGAEAERAWEKLAQDLPGALRHVDGTRIDRVYGRELSFGSTARESADRFVAARAALFGVEPSDLQPVDAATRLPTQTAAPLDLMHDPRTGEPKLSLFRYRQVRGGVPVYDAGLAVVVRNESRRPVVLAASSLRSLGGYSPGAQRAANAFVPPTEASLTTTDFRGESIDVVAGKLTGFSEPEPVIWAGLEDQLATPTLAVTYVADNDADPQRTRPLRLRVVADARTGAVLHQESLVVFDVSGHVAGRVTEGDASMECSPESPRSFAHARVQMSTGSYAHADAAGDYTIVDPTTSEVQVTSPVRGEFFRVRDFSGPAERLSVTVQPSESLDFLHNPTPDVELVTGQANGYSNADEIRDWALSFHPTYPVIADQVDFPVNVNQTSGYCPGNAWYDGVSINFCIANPSYGNTSFASVSHHEYGHHLVDSGGSGQGAYGEGMSDVVATIFADDPGLGYGFFAGDCVNPLRTADNDCQFVAGPGCSTCGSEVHDCGNLIAGAIWSTRKALAVSEPVDGLAILAQLVVNSILLHNGEKITPAIAADFLTLDDDDANLDNGTPHRLDICEGFGAHGLACPVLANYLDVQLPVSALEDAGVLVGQGTVTVQIAPVSDMVVTLASSDPSLLGVPPEVTILAGETSVSFDLTLVDDNLLNGARSVSVTASGDLQAGRSWMDVLDDETATLVLSLPPSVVESDATPVGGLVTSDQPVDADITVTLSSSDTSELVAPVSVVIPAGATSVGFSLSTVDDNALDGTQPVTIGAQVAGWTSGETSVDVLDDEEATLELLLPTVGEADGTLPLAGRVRLGGTLDADLVVSLQSGDETELVLPPEVVVLAGRLSGRFDLTAVDDDVSDGTIQVSVQAQAAGFATGNAIVDVLDDDAHHFVVTLVDSPPFLASEPFTVQATAMNAAGEPMPAYGKMATVSAATGSGPLPLVPTDASFFEGSFTGSLQIDALAEGAVLHFEDAAGVAGDSASFDVVAGPMAGFAVGDLPGEIHATVPFGATVYAIDAHGFAADFTGPATLSGLRDVPSVLEALVWFPNPSDPPRVVDAIQRFFAPIMVGTSSSTAPFALASELSGKDLLVIATHGELTELELVGLGSQWAAVLTAFVEDGGTLVVCSGPYAEHQLLVSSGLLDVESITISPPQYVRRALTHPLSEGFGFQFQARNTVHTYEVSEPGAATVFTLYGDAVVVSREFGRGHVVLVGNDFAAGTMQSPMDRVLANAAAWALSGAGTPVAVSPSLVLVAGGSWQGNLTVASPMSELTIVVDDGIGHTGRSAAFEVLP